MYCFSDIYEGKGKTVTFFIKIIYYYLLFCMI